MYICQNSSIRKFDVASRRTRTILGGAHWQGQGFDDGAGTNAKFVHIKKGAHRAAAACLACEVAAHDVG